MVRGYVEKSPSFPVFAALNLVLAAVWLAIAFTIGRRFTRLTAPK